jgi:hypothetical protein
MLRFLGLILLTSFIVRALASGLFTIDVPGTAGLIQETGGYLMGGTQSQQTQPRVRSIPYNPETGRVRPQRSQPPYTF